jgi:hypothetical protein
MLDDALYGRFSLCLLRFGSQGLNLLQQRDEVMGIAEQDLVELSQRIGGRVVSVPRNTSIAATAPLESFPPRQSNPRGRA